MAKGITVQQSRFALLNIEGSDDDSDGIDSKKDKNSNKNAQQSASAKKKKNKKKKDADTAELRNLAFGSGGKKGNKGQQQQKQQNGAGLSESKVPENQWEEWKQHDQELTSDTYQADLQAAILQSKLEFELEKEGKTKGKENGDGDAKPSKKKNKKKSTMTLEEFNKKVENTPRGRSRFSADVDELGLDGEPDTPPPEPEVTPPPSEPDPEFFKKIKKDANRIIEHERIQEQYKKHYIVENARIQQFEEKLLKKDREIAMLRTSHDKVQDELKVVKKRNQQLCFIIGQGEMKDKKSVLLELEEMRVERDDLREQVHSLTTELEKERTKVHGLKDENYKLKESKGK